MTLFTALAFIITEVTNNNSRNLGSQALSGYVAMVSRYI